MYQSSTLFKKACKSIEQRDYDDWYYPQIMDLLDKVNTIFLSHDLLHQPAHIKKNVSV
jgi:hypothetical protein